MPLDARQPLGRTGLDVPPILFGTSALGNLYQALDYEEKKQILAGCFAHVAPPVVLDTAGKYGAGLALEMIGHILRDLDVPPEKVLISNKLGWKRVALTAPEPTFEPGAWVGIDHDAEKAVSYDGIGECWQQGLELLGEPYRPRIVSVHDPDEYLDAATDSDDRARRFDDVLGAYRALGELKASGEVAAVGVGSKDWTVIRELASRVKLDWVMLACSLTVYTHPPELLAFVEELRRQGTAVVNSAVFNAGFLVGGGYFDYVQVTPEDRPELFAWRETFLAACHRHAVNPAEACVQFGLAPAGVVAVALNTSRPARVADNVRAVTAEIPPAFWADLKHDHLIAEDYPV